jgi:capsule assembly protein Wzi
MMTTVRRILLLSLLALLQAPVQARGVTPYLPLNLDPEVEREVERVLVLGDKPVMTRPIPAALVLDALPKACEIDPVLCNRVRRVLKQYMKETAVEFVSVEGAITNGAKTVMPNQHGETEQSPYQVSGAAYWQPSDYALINVGGVAYQGRETATGSFISLGFDWAQLDIGYRDHWWSPMTDSSVLISTEAPTMPSVTLSNYDPFTRLGIQYEAFLARMSYTDKIELTDGSLTAGYPKFAGARLQIEPGNGGWSLGANRIIVFGGGAAGGQSISDVLQAFFNPTKSQTTGFGNNVEVIGKQEASLTSRFIFPGQHPFSVYFEFAGNDSTSGDRLLFSKTVLSAGLHFPKVGPFDFTYEFSEWQPTWYVKGFTSVQNGYGDGITNDRLIIGSWFGDQRQFGDAVGGQSNMFRVGWEPHFGGRFEGTFRTLVNDSYYSAIPYHHEFMGSLSYAHPWKDYVVGTEVDYGRDVYGATYSRFAGFLRYGDALRDGDYSDDEAVDTPRPDHAELFVDVGASATRIESQITSDTPRINSGLAAGPHIALGARRAVSEHQDLGVAFEGDDVHGVSLISARIVDYRYRFDNPLAINLFGGAARYAAATPAYGFYFGGGLQWRNILPHWDIGIDYRYATKVDRLRSLPTDPQGGYRPDAYYDISLGTLYVSRKF